MEIENSCKRKPNKESGTTTKAMKTDKSRSFNLIYWQNLEKQATNKRINLERN